MTYIAISRSKIIDKSLGIEAETPLFIKVSSRGMDNQPILGFASIELGERYLEWKNISQGDYQFVLKDKGLIEKYINRSVFIIENATQIDEMEKDAEGYDYEGHIYRSAL